MTRLYDGSIQSRKGQVLLRRFGTTVAFESTIEERALRVWHIDPGIVAIQRAEPVEYHLPDGSSHTYTPDFTLSLLGGRVVTIECKPQALLPALLAEDPIGWQTRAARLAQMNRPMYVVTDADIPPERLQQVLTFGRFFNHEIHPLVQQTATNVLSERGAMPLSALRTFITAVSKLDTEEVDASLCGLLAAHILVAEAGVCPPACRVDLAGRSIPTEPTMLGQSVMALLQTPPSVPPDDMESEASHDHRERVFRASARGQRLHHLFSLYSDPSNPLSQDDVERLTQICGVSRATLFRFRDALAKSGAPGVTFSEVVACLLRSQHGQPRHQVDIAVAQLIENLATAHYFVRVGTLARAGTLAQLHLMVRQSCLAEELPPPAYTTVQRHVERIRLRDPVRAALLRYGKEESQKLEARQGWLELHRYGELIAVDCTPCDIFTLPDGSFRLSIKSGRGKGQRPTGAKRGNIVTVVDVMTSQVLRSVIFMTGIGAAQILLVLRDLFLGNSQDMQNAGVKIVPQARGLPERIRMDAGTEFVNKEVTRVLGDLGIETLSRNKWSRHHGGHEERVIGILTQFHQLLPGTTTNTIANRGDYDSSREALFTTEDLNAFHQRMVERHNQLCGQFQESTRQEHAAHLLSVGMSAWQPLTTVHRGYLLTRMRPMEVKTCDAVGIRMHGLQYVSPALQSLIVRRAKVEVLFNPDDITQATAIHPNTGQSIPLEARLPQGIAAPLSLKAWSELKARFRAAKQVALDRAKTPQQLALDVDKERRERIQKLKKLEGKAPLALKSLTPDPTEDTHGKSSIRAADITFEHNPPVKA